MIDTAEQLPTMELVPGIYPGLSNEQYHACEGMSKTKLDMFIRDQAALDWMERCPVDEDKLKTLDFGDAMHAICLEPDRLKNDFVVMPPYNLRTNQGKADKLAFEKDNADKVILTSDEHKKLTLMFESVMAHKDARQLIELPGISEQSYFWEDPETGVLCKCRPDRNITEGPFSSVLVDIKTTDYISKFKYSIEDYRYYVQSPFYLDGVNACGEEKTTFVFLVIQKTIELGRYPVRCEVLPDAAVKYGRNEYKQNLFSYASARKNNRFNGIYESELSDRFMNKVYSF